MGAKTDTSTTKYEIRATFEIEGVVEKPDIIGGIYGQTDGLLSENLDIRELQKTGRIGRINVELNSRRGKTTGKIIIPSSLSRMETAILAATVETVDRVGPCSCKVQLEEIIDVRISKRQSIVDRASEIIRQWDQNVSPFSSSIALEVEKSAKTNQILSLGEEGFSVGPGFERQKKVILVEGRADVVNLLKFGVDNTVAVNGTSIPPKLLDLIKKKTVTAFLDGDRGGDLILKELLQIAKIDYVARAPKGKEVEDLSKEEVEKALKEVASLENAIFLTGSDEGITVKDFLGESKPKKKEKSRLSKAKKVLKKKESEPQEKPTKKLIEKKVVEKLVTRTDPKPVVQSKSETVGKPPARTSDRRPPTRTSDRRPPTRTSDRRPPTRTSDRRPPTRSTSTSRRPPSRGSSYDRPPRREIRKVELPDHLTKVINEIKTKLEVVIFDENNKEILRSSTANIYKDLEKLEKGVTLVIDGVITQRLLERVKAKGINLVIGARKGEITKKPIGIKIVEFKQV
ncbi:MAG: DNA primase [Asgard group archaeon]|nr:DNA primase [Asgard group archaeon]